MRAKQTHLQLHDTWREVIGSRYRHWYVKCRCSPLGLLKASLDSCGVPRL